MIASGSEDKQEIRLAKRRQIPERTTLPKRAKLLRPETLSPLRHAKRTEQEELPINLGERVLLKDVNAARVGI